MFTRFSAMAIGNSRRHAVYAKANISNNGPRLPDASVRIGAEAHVKNEMIVRRKARNHWPAALHPRQRQTGREAGTQSQGPAATAVGSLAAEWVLVPAAARAAAGEPSTSDALTTRMRRVRTTFGCGRGVCRPVGGDRHRQTTADGPIIT